MANVVATWTRDIDYSSPDRNLARALVTLTLTASTGLKDFPVGGLSLPSLAQLGLQNVKKVVGLPNIFNLAGLGICVPNIDISTPTAPKLFLYGNDGATDLMVAKSSSGGVTDGAYTLKFELVGNAG